ncbi:helix-turn-helix transcriptional regulator [Solwaraspora sp. WMMA2080]|uniref:helix-turn-helix domain-containing protein n=1 Tax=unclassified Solwaraspora TaxID=2627926 RepID=UPI00248B2CAD|nr:MULTISPECIES: helix-turn-helix transcriptional regulator [unclassified Solwaraspora]WBB97538.1 helix-turn-helix transcriptional regulator [Solwaraspora sp. WMMA2059]WBC18569.1 helix-turn-helix transcriptional regulator [Solwaraspora sp. WMMA2080]
MPLSRPLTGKGYPMATIGDNIAQVRRRQSITQEQLAAAAGVSTETIRKLETNQRTTPRIATLHAIARALGVPTTTLLGDASTGAARRERGHRPLALLDLRRVLIPARGPAGLIADEVPALPAAGVPGRLAEADRAYHQGDYAAALAVLPPLIAGARHAVENADDANRPAAYRTLARTYDLTSSLLIQVRAVDLAYQAVNAAQDAAASAGDELLSATTVKRMSWLLLRQGRLTDAERLAIATADSVEPRISRATPDELAVWGWLMMAAAAASARDNRPDDAVAQLDAAAAAAARLGSRPVSAGHLTIVGGMRSTKVDMMRAEAAAVAGEPRRVLDLATNVRRGGAEKTSWRRHRLDVARAHAELRDWSEATAVLSELAADAPVWLRHQRYARDTVRMITTSRRRAMGQELAKLAALMDGQAA